MRSIAQTIREKIENKKEFQFLKDFKKYHLNEEFRMFDINWVLDVYNKYREFETDYSAKAMSLRDYCNWITKY